MPTESENRSESGVISVSDWGLGLPVEIPYMGGCAKAALWFLLAIFAFVAGFAIDSFFSSAEENQVVLEDITGSEEPRYYYDYNQGLHN